MKLKANQNKIKVEERRRRRRKQRKEIVNRVHVGGYIYVCTIERKVHRKKTNFPVK